MRLICPSCGAQYEVDESVIPDGGRDVQCSNCGQAWFQQSSQQLSAEEAGTAVVEPALAAAAGPGPEPVEEPTAPAPERARRAMDDTVRSVLREEAERETQARVAEGTSVESQPELGLAAAIGAAAATTGGPVGTPAAEDRATGDAQDFDGDAVVSRSSRRELLPDIEEINSTLRATSERGSEAAAFDAPETLARRRSGFRMGFSTALLVAAVLLALYVLSPLLSRAVPPLEPVLSTYVAGVDAGRLWLDERMRSLTQSLQDAPPE